MKTTYRLTLNNEPRQLTVADLSPRDRFTVNKRQKGGNEYQLMSRPTGNCQHGRVWCLTHQKWTAYPLRLDDAVTLINGTKSAPAEVRVDEVERFQPFRYDNGVYVWVEGSSPLDIDSCLAFSPGLTYRRKNSFTYNSTKVTPVSGTLHIETAQ